MTSETEDPDNIIWNPDDVKRKLLRNEAADNSLISLPDGVCWLEGRAYRQGSMIMKDGAQIICRAGRWDTISGEGSGNGVASPPDVFDDMAQP